MVDIQNVLIKVHTYNEGIIIGISFRVMIIIQLLVAYNMVVNPSWDFKIVFNGAVQLAEGNYALDPYFWQWYPNNIGSVIFLGILFKPLSYFTSNINHFLVYGILINIIMILMAQATLIWLIYRNKGLKIAAFTSVFMLFITPFYFYVPIVYTDTLEMIFPIIAILIMDIYEKSTNYRNNKKGSYIILMAIISTIGILIKTNVIITLIAIVIYFIMKHNFFESLKKVATIFIVFSIIMIGYRYVVQKIIPIPYNESGLPATHWVMMGMTGNGWYNQEDADLSRKIYGEFGKEAVAKANIEVIKKRLKDYGIRGYLKFINHKLEVTWNDGTYFAPVKLCKTPFKKTKIHTYITGENNIYYMYISQFMHIILLSGIVLSVIKNFKHKINMYIICHIALFGTVLFLLIWETRSRYIVCMLPIMIFCAMDGFESLCGIVSRKKSRSNP